ncbi:MAG: hypothetical protein R3B13_37940 [Polyangiaceae bacterium]
MSLLAFPIAGISAAVLAAAVVVIAATAFAHRRRRNSSNTGRVLAALIGAACIAYLVAPRHVEACVRGWVLDVAPGAFAAADVLDGL